MKKHILVTGGAGYIGSVLVGHLLGREYRVTIIDSLTRGYGGYAIHTYHRNKNFKHYNVRVDQIKEINYSIPPDVHAVVHLAARLRVVPGHEHILKSENSEATRVIYEAAARARVEKFVFASTYFNYGKQSNTIPVDETAKVNPWDVYTESKVEDERYILGQMGKPGFTIAPIIFRFAQAYGLSSNMRWDLLINRFVRDAMVDKKIVVFEGNVTRAFIHVYDIARAIEYALRDWPANRRGWGEILNVGGEHYTKDEIARLIQRKSPKPVEIEYSNHKTTNSMPGTRISFDKIQEKWGWQQTRSVSLGLGAMMRDGKELGLF